MTGLVTLTLPKLGKRCTPRKSLTLSALSDDPSGLGGPALPSLHLTASSSSAHHCQQGPEDPLLHPRERRRLSAPSGLSRYYGATEARPTLPGVPRRKGGATGSAGQTPSGCARAPERRQSPRACNPDETRWPGCPAGSSRYPRLVLRCRYPPREERSGERWWWGRRAAGSVLFLRAGVGALLPVAGGRAARG